MPPRVDNYDARPVLPRFEAEEPEDLHPAVLARLMNLREPENARGGMPFAPRRFNREQGLIARWLHHPVQRAARNARNLFHRLARCLQLPR